MHSPLVRIEIVRFGAPVSTSGGSSVRLRQCGESDRDLISVFAPHRLTPPSPPPWALAPMPNLAARALARLPEVDPGNLEVIAATDADSGEVIGVAHFAREPGRSDAAEFGVTVVPAHRSRGVGNLLTEVISARARAAGVCHFLVFMLMRDASAAALLGDGAAVWQLDPEIGLIEVELPVARLTPAPALRRLLAVCAGQHESVTASLSAPAACSSEASRRIRRPRLHPRADGTARQARDALV